MRRKLFIMSIACSAMVLGTALTANAAGAAQYMGSVVKTYAGGSPYGSNTATETATKPGRARYYEQANGVRITLYTYNGTEEGAAMKYSKLTQVGMPVTYSKDPAYQQGSRDLIGTFVSTESKWISVATDEAKSIASMGYNGYINTKRIDMQGGSISVAQWIGINRGYYRSIIDADMNHELDRLESESHGELNVRIIAEYNAIVAKYEKKYASQCAAMEKQYRDQYNALASAENYLYQNDVVSKPIYLSTMYTSSAVPIEGTLQKLAAGSGDPAIKNSKASPGSGYASVSDTKFTEVTRNIADIPGAGWYTGNPGDTRTLKDDFQAVAAGSNPSEINLSIDHMAKALGRTTDDSLSDKFYDEVAGISRSMGVSCMSKDDFHKAPKRLIVVEPVHAIDIITDGKESGLSAGDNYVTKSRLFLTARECTAFWKAGYTKVDGSLQVGWLQQSFSSACDIYPMGAFGLANSMTYTANSAQAVASNSWSGAVGIGIFTLGRVSNPDSVWESPPALSVNVFNKVAQDAGTNDYRISSDSLNNPVYKDSLTVSIPQSDWTLIYNTLMYAKTDKSQYGQLTSKGAFPIIEELRSWIDAPENKDRLVQALQTIAKVDPANVWNQDKTVEYQSSDRKDQSNSYSGDYVEKYRDLWNKILNSSAVKGKALKVDVPTKTGLSTDIIDTGGSEIPAYGSKLIQLKALTPRGDNALDTARASQQAGASGANVYAGLAKQYPVTMYNVNYIKGLSNAAEWLDRASAWKDIEGSFKVNKVEVRVPDLKYSANNLTSLLTQSAGNSTAYIDAFQKNSYNANTQMFSIDKGTGYKDVQDVTNFNGQIEIPYSDLLQAPYGSNLNFYVELDQPKAVTLDVMVKGKTAAYSAAYQTSVAQKNAVFDPNQVVKADTKLIGVKKMFDLPESYDFKSTLGERVGADVANSINAQYLTTYKISMTQPMTVESIAMQTGTNYEIANQILTLVDKGALERKSANMKADYDAMVAARGELDNVTRQPNANIYVTLWADVGDETGSQGGQNQTKDKVEQWQLDESVNGKVEATWDVAAMVPTLRDTITKKYASDVAWYSGSITKIPINGQTWVEGTFGKYITVGDFDKGDNPFVLKLNKTQFQNPVNLSTGTVSIGFFPLYDKHSQSSLFTVDSPLFSKVFTDPGTKQKLAFTGDNAMQITAVVHRNGPNSLTPELAAYMANPAYKSNNKAYKDFMQKYMPVQSDSDFALEKPAYVEKYGDSSIATTSSLYRHKTDVVAASAKVNSNIVLSYGWNDSETFDTEDSFRDQNGLYDATKKWNRAINETSDVMRVEGSVFSEMTANKPAAPVKNGDKAWAFMPITKLALGVDVVKPYSGKSVSGDSGVITGMAGVTESGSRAVDVFDGQNFTFNPTYQMSYTSAVGASAGQPLKDAKQTAWVLSNQRRTVNAKDALVIDWNSKTKINANWSRDYEDNVAQNNGIPTLKAGDQYKFASTNNQITITGYVHVMDPDFVASGDRASVTAANNSRKSAMHSILQAYASQLVNKDTFGSLSNVKGGFSKSMEQFGAELSGNSSELNKTLQKLSFDLPGSVGVSESAPLRLEGNLGQQVGGQYYSPEYGLDFNTELRKSLEADKDSWYAEDFEGLEIVKFQVTVSMPEMASSYQTINSKESDFRTARSESAGGNSGQILNKLSGTQSDPGKIFASNCYSLASVVNLKSVSSSFYNVKQTVLFGERVDLHIKGSVYDNT